MRDVISLNINTPNYVFQTSVSGVTITRVKDGAMRTLNTPDVATVLGEMFVGASPPVRTALLPLIFSALE